MNIAVHGTVQGSPREYFTQVMEEWKSGQNNPEDVAEVEDFIEKNFAGWG